MKATMKLFTGLLAIGLVSAVASQASANINLHGASCTTGLGSNVGNIGSSGNGLQTIAGAPAQLIQCAVPRAPLSGQTTATVFVDGQNLNGASTSCALLSINFNNVVLGSASATSSAANFDMALSLPASQAPTFAYFLVSCSVPGNANGRLLGVTSVQ